MANRLTALPPAYLIPNHLMSSQPGNLQDLTAYSGHLSSFIIGSEAEPDSSSRNQFSQPAPLPSDMGLRYMINSASDDARFGPDSGTSQNSVFSIEGNLPTSSPSTVPFSSFPNVFQPTLSGATAYSPASSFFPSSYYMQDIKPVPGYHSNSDLKHNLGYRHSPDIKPVLGSFPSPVMAPPSRSPHLQHLGSPVTARELYTSATPQLRRQSEVISRSPPTIGTMRGLPLSPSSSSGFASPVNTENSNNPKANPPLQLTEQIYSLQTSDGQAVRPEILGKIDKGFFMAENDWTCYRRNYFQLSCSYTLHPYVPITNVHLSQGGNLLQVHAFSMTIAAVVDGRDGRAIELVQHTPKRDKGPQVRPDRVTLAPRPHPSAAMYTSSSSGGDITMGGARSNLYETGYGSSTNQPQMEHTFERIQFKQATANNGKRRAAQQYYHLLVELFADVGASMGDGRWIKVAQRVSAPMVVRGRSPGHYHSERRPSNASAGGSAGGGGSYGSNGGITPRPNEPVSLSTGSSAVAHGTYGSGYEQRTHYFPPAHASHINTPMEPMMSQEEAKAIDEADGYLYYPAPLFEGSAPHARYNDNSPYTLPNLASHKIKQEFPIHGHNHGHSSYSLPSLTAGTHLDSLGRQCGRFEGLPTSKGYFPTMFNHPEINTS